MNECKAFSLPAQATGAGRWTLLSLHLLVMQRASLHDFVRPWTRRSNARCSFWTLWWPSCCSHQSMCVEHNHWFTTRCWLLPTSERVCVGWQRHVCIVHKLISLLCACACAQQHFLYPHKSYVDVCSCTHIIGNQHWTMKTPSEWLSKQSSSNQFSLTPSRLAHLCTLYQQDVALVCVQRLVLEGTQHRKHMYATN